MLGSCGASSFREANGQGTTLARDLARVVRVQDWPQVEVEYFHPPQINQHFNERCHLLNMGSASGSIFQGDRLILTKTAVLSLGSLPFLKKEILFQLGQNVEFTKTICKRTREADLYCGPIKEEIGTGTIVQLANNKYAQLKLRDGSLSQFIPITALKILNEESKNFSSRGNTLDTTGENENASPAL